MAQIIEPDESQPENSAPWRPARMVTSVLDVKITFFFLLSLKGEQDFN